MVDLEIFWAWLCSTKLPRCHKVILILNQFWNDIFGARNLQPSSPLYTVLLQQLQLYDMTWLWITCAVWNIQMWQSDLCTIHHNFPWKVCITLWYACSQPTIKLFCATKLCYAAPYVSLLIIIV